MIQDEDKSASFDAIVKWVAQAVYFVVVINALAFVIFSSAKDAHFSPLLNPIVSYGDALNIVFLLWAVTKSVKLGWRGE